ncbi:MFS transporter [uncultured Pseudokineococcus sp.]|uniref:MFS transporter n=1 Tax=uncultured Pseudokineococcus sp. TaxID=1642928 RepID=UPI0026385FB6|nr:MFS transporter [uncultured Pseudokineococcus sp.]
MPDRDADRPLAGPAGARPAAADASPATTGGRPGTARSVLAGVLVATLLAALDLVAAAVAAPALVLDLELERALAVPAAASVVGLVLAVPLAARASARGPRARLLVVAAALVVAGAALVALAPVPTGAGGDDPASVLAVGAGRLLAGAGAGALVVGAGATLASTVPAGLQVRVQAALVLVTGVGAVLGALVGGLLADVPAGWRVVPLLAPVLALVALVLLRSVRSLPRDAAGPPPEVATPLGALGTRVVLLGAVAGGVVGAVAVAVLVEAPLVLGLERPLLRGLLVAAGVLAGVVGVVAASAAVARLGARPQMAQVGTVGLVVAVAGLVLLPRLAGAGQATSVLPLLLVGAGLGAVVQGTGLVVSLACPPGQERQATGALGAARRAGALGAALVVMAAPLLGAVDGTGAGPQGVLDRVVVLGGALLLLACVPLLGVLPRQGEVRHPPTA